MIIILILPVETLRPDQIKWTCLVLQVLGPDSLAPESMSTIMAAHSLPFTLVHWRASNDSNQGCQDL